jgi:hypothetical protein
VLVLEFFGAAKERRMPDRAGYPALNINELWTGEGRQQALGDGLQPRSGSIFPLSAFTSVSTAAICALTRASIGKGFGVSTVKLTSV